jgi:LacI family transcriptional regulator
MMVSPRWARNRCSLVLGASQRDGRARISECRAALVDPGVAALARLTSEPGRGRLDPIGFMKVRSSPRAKSGSPGVSEVGGGQSTDTRVLVMMDAVEGWARRLLRGVNEIALERGWMLLLYSPHRDFRWVLREWSPSAVIVGPNQLLPLPPELSGRLVVGANADLSSERLPWVGVDDVDDLAADHLLSKGLQQFATFSFEPGGWAGRRLARFKERIAEAGGRCHSDGGLDLAKTEPHTEAESILAWLRALPTPCGVFACCDTWARVVACYCRGTGLRVPEDIALIGADDDPVECELTAPALSSVAIPWREVGREVAMVLRRGLDGKLPTEPVLVRPTHVVGRRSSDILAVDEPLVAAAVAWIHEHSDQQILVNDVVRAMNTYRQRLERRFRAVLGRSVMVEVRRSRVERAKRLLAMTDLSLLDVALKSGFTSASLLNAAFRREARTTPGAFRRRATTGPTID